MADRTILDLYRHDVDSPRAVHYRHVTSGGDRRLSTEEFFRTTSALAEGLVRLGVGKGDRIMLLSDNRPEWHMVDLACLDLGAVDVPVYGTLTAEQIAYQANDSGAVAAVVDTSVQLEKFLAIRDRCPTLKHVVQIDGSPPDGVLELNEIISAGDTGGAGERFWKRAAAVDESQLATIIYTSGTTGEPKGVMLSHRNLVQNVLAAGTRAPIGREDLALEFLPLCHVLERMVSYILMWRATSKAYCSIYEIGDLIQDIAPTIFTAVPRFYEKIHHAVQQKAAAAPAAKRALFDWALKVGRKAAFMRLAGQEPSGLFAQQLTLAEKAVLSKVRQALGGRVRYCIYGGAELPLHVAEFLHSVGIFVVEGYGLTETSPVIAVNGVRPGEIRLGTVGKPLTNVEIALADDGELLVKGPSIMSGYWNKPEQTAEVFYEEGFFHTGDIAEVDDDGFVLIVDRKKDLIVTAGGKNIAPQPIENRLKQSPLVDSAVLIGDGKPFVVALISPELEALAQRAQQEGIEFSDPIELIGHPKVDQLYEELVSAANGGLARFEQIKRFQLLPRQLTVEGGQLTPTLKVKRRVIEAQFSELIENLYSDRGTA